MSYYERLIESVLARFSRHVITVYPWVSTAADIYQQGERTYGEPVEVAGHYVRKGDPDITDPNGKKNMTEDDFVVFSLPELRRKFPSADEGEWITTSDIIEYFGTKYSIREVDFTGFMLGGTKLLRLRLMECPDATDY